MAIGDITLGQGPGSNQVNLAQMRANANSVMAPGMLGNKVNNPMSDVIATGGDAGLGYQNAIANSRMMNLALQAKQQALQQEMQKYEQNQQKPGLLDFLGLGISGLGAAKGAGLFNGTQYKPQIYSPDEALQIMQEEQNG